MTCGIRGAQGRLNRILGAILKLLKKLEWSGEQYYYDDKCTLPICPVCHRRLPFGDEDDERYRGHGAGCELAAVMESIEDYLLLN